MVENKIEKTGKKVIILELDLKPEYYGISKNEVTIYLKQLDVEPLNIDIISLNKIYVELTSDK